MPIEKQIERVVLHADLHPEIRPDISSEIRMLRHAIERLYRESQEVEEIDDQARILGALGLAINRLCNLIKAQGSQDEWQDEKAHRAAEALAQALDEIASEWELDK